MTGPASGCDELAGDGGQSLGITMGSRVHCRLGDHLVLENGFPVLRLGQLIPSGSHGGPQLVCEYRVLVLV